MQNIAVLKFGGTSVKNIARIRHVAELIGKFPAKKKIVIVSAMGDTTDHLIRMAKQCTVQPSEREMDLLLATGEQVSITLLAITLDSLGLKAKSYTGAQLGILTDSQHSSARIIDINRELLTKAIQENDVVVIAGFQGCSQQGEVTTLGRGGSDTSAVAIAAAINADFCHIFTDVDGIFSADPSFVKDAKFLPVISYKETLELARSGAQVIHPRAVELAEDHDIQLRVRNTFRPQLEGTLILGEEFMERKQCISGVAVESNVACLEIRGQQEPTTPLFELQGSQKILVDALTICHDSLGGNATSLITFKYVDEDDFKIWAEHLQGRLSGCQIRRDCDVSKVSLIGKGLSADVGCLPRFLSALERNGIGVRQLDCKDSRISVIVSADRAELAAQVIHSEFVGQIQDSSQDTTCWTRGVA